MRVLILSAFLALSPALVLADDVETGCAGIAIEDCAAHAGEIGHEPPPADFEAARAAGFVEVEQIDGDRADANPDGKRLVSVFAGERKIQGPFGTRVLETSLGTDRNFLIVSVLGADFEPQNSPITGLRLLVWVQERTGWRLVLDAADMGLMFKLGRIAAVQPQGFAEWRWDGWAFRLTGRTWSTEYPAE